MPASNLQIQKELSLYRINHKGTYMMILNLRRIENVQDNILQET